MKDLLLFTPVDNSARSKFEFFPLGILSLSSFMEAHGFETDVLHGEVEDIPVGYKFYGISATTNQYSIAKLALNYIRCIQPNAIVILGGPHLNAQSCIDICHEDGWDYLVQGEGELALLSILEGQVNTKVICGTPVLNLNQLTIPNYSKLDFTKYNFPLDGNSRCATLITARGCPYKCIFCSTAGSKLRQYPVERVEQELYLLKSLGFNSFMFVDDTMSINKNRFHRILSYLKEIKTPWRSYGRVNALSKDDIELMISSQCRELALGIESGSQFILDLIRKGTKAKKNLEFVHLCKSIGLKTNAMVIIGLPGETIDTIKETEDWMEKAKPEAFGFNMFFPFPDAPIWNEMENFKQHITIYPYQWDDAQTKAKQIDKCFVSTPSLSRDKILEEYYRCFEKFVNITGFDPRLRGRENIHDKVL